MNFTHAANPVRVKAHAITRIEQVGDDYVAHTIAGETDLEHGMIARYMPVAGDYIVTQEDGYVYVNPKDVFERKYSPI